MLYDNHHSATPRKSSSKKIILCLHGAGTSAAIFSAQARHVREALRHQFQFIFIDGPNIRGPGPGVLPYFADSGPYYGWFSDRVTDPSRYGGNSTSNMMEIATEVVAVNKAVKKALAQKGVCTSDVAGVMGFSQGALLASLLMFQGRNGDVAWSGLQFGILICGACVDGLVDMIAGGTRKLDIPSLHVVGRDDPWNDGSRMLKSEGFRDDTSVLMEFEGGHHIPTELHDLERMKDVMIEMSQRRGVRTKRREDVKVETKVRSYEVFV